MTAPRDAVKISGLNVPVSRSSLGVQASRMLFMVPLALQIQVKCQFRFVYDEIAGAMVQKRLL
jgi:hypothetical protein